MIIPDEWPPQPLYEMLTALPPRPAFNPGRLVLDVMELLGRHYGIETIVESTAAGPAVNAAADLLRALGVTPATAPVLPKAPR